MTTLLAIGYLASCVLAWCVMATASLYALGLVRRRDAPAFAFLSLLGPVALCAALIVLFRVYFGVISTPMRRKDKGD